MSGIRIGGMASGMDTETMVKELMKAESAKVDKVEQSKQLTLWRQEAYNDLNKDFANFILDTKKDFGLTTTSVSNLDWVKGVTSSNESIATASAAANAIDGTYNITVHKLADTFSAASKSNITTGTDKTSIANQFSDITTGTVTFSIETQKNEGTPQTFTFDVTTKSMDDIVKEINNADLGVTAVYDSSIDRFFIQTEETGSENWIKINDTTSIDGKNFINDRLKLAYDNGGVLTDLENNTQKLGEDALIDFGAATNITQSSNQFTINGIDLNLKSTGSITVKTDTDVDAIYAKISSFVEKYNALIDKTGKKLVEKKYRDYAPLTADQKKELSDKDVERWESKAKSGLLRSDNTYTRTMSNMRIGLYEAVEGVSGSYENLFDIGITTEKYATGTVGGKLQIDEEDLKEAIRNDADGVLDLLFKQADTSSIAGYDVMTDAEKEKAVGQNSGLVTRLYDTMIDGMKEVINKAGTGDDVTLYRNVQSNMLLDFVKNYSSISMIDKDITSVNKKISDMNNRLTKLENSYWKKFTAMEKAIANMQSQSASLASMLG